MRVRRLTLPAAMAAACCGGAAAASAITGSAPSHVHDEVDARHLRARPGTEILGASADDPVGGPQWAVRRSSSETGSLCVEIGRFDGRVFGAIAGDGTVTSQPLADHGTCATAEGGPLVVVARFAATDALDARTVVYGHVGQDVRRVVVRAGAHEREVPVGAGGTFVWPVTGIRDPGDITIEATSTAGVLSAERL